MIHEQDLRMPRTMVDGDYQPFTYCTGIGSLGDFSSAQETNAFDKELGTGVTIYFKLLRYLGLMFLFFSILSIPTYVIFRVNGQTNDSKKKSTSIGNIVSSFSLGNVGESTLSCETVSDYNKKMQVTCPRGQIQGFVEIGLISTNC